MTRSRFLFCILSLLLVLPIITGSLKARDQEAAGDSLYKHLAVFTEVLSLVRQAYVEPADETELLVGALDGATDALDPFSLYVPPEGVEAYRAARKVGSQRSGLVLLRERSVVYVVGVLPGSPADKNDLRVGDVITEIGGDSTRPMPLWRLQAMLAGAPGSELKLNVLRGGETLEVAFELGTFTVPPPELREVDGVHLLTVSSFDASALSEITKALEALRQAPTDRLLVDLRGVSGGEAETAYKAAGLFTDGDLGGLRNRSKELLTFRGGDVRWGGRVAVLIDRGTLGPAEVFATILRQKLDSDLIGERSFGYAGRVREVELAAGGRLWITDAFYTGPDGEPLNSALQPDVPVSSFRGVQDPEEGEEEKDPVLERGIQFLLEDEPEEAEQKAA